jgi:hypothetical protein
MLLSVGGSAVHLWMSAIWPTGADTQRQVVEGCTMSVSSESAAMQIDLSAHQHVGLVVRLLVCFQKSVQLRDESISAKPKL